MDELRPDRKPMGAGGFARGSATGATGGLAARFKLGVMIRGHPFQAVVLVVHRITQDVVDGDAGRAGRQALRAAHPAVPRRGLLAIAGDHFLSGPV